MRDLTITRRHMLLGAAAIGATSTVGFDVSNAFAKTPMPDAQAPYFYRFKHGDMRATVVSDGILPLGDPTATFLGNSKEAVMEMLTNNFLDTSNVILEQNILVLDAGEKRILFDTGMGSSTMFGQTTGQLMKNLKTAGIDPASIDAIVLTHGHPDHAWGIMTSSGERNFPNAQIYISQVDFDFWTDESKLAVEEKFLGAFVKGARDNLLPNRDRIIFVTDGEEFLPGVQAMAAPGHTLGHTMFILTSNGSTMALIGDLAHHHVMLIERPMMQFAFDIDPELSARTRSRVLEMLATERMPSIAYHFPWPGIGHIAKRGDGYQFLPAPMIMQELPG